MILEEIVAHKRLELEAARRATSLDQLRERITRQSPPLDFVGALRGESIRLIAEVKKASPSRGVMRQETDPVPLARAYSQAGANAISVLTDERYFRGSLDDLAAVKAALAAAGLERPVLRKDFTIDPYQVYEARAWGADAILLIVRVLTQDELVELQALAQRLDMGCLVEVHDEAEVERAVQAGARVIGINNRDLATFAVDIGTTARLRPLIPTDRVVVAESGISQAEQVRRLVEWKVDAMLVGEALVRAGEPGEKIRELLSVGVA